MEYKPLINYGAKRRQVRRVRVSWFAVGYVAFTASTVYLLITGLIMRGVL